MADEFDRYFDKVNNANIESAKRQMQFQAQMSNTSHQREVNDLIAAGLNPVLSANNGASSPMGAYASIDSSPISAKFASKNLDKELNNARLITAMQNDNAMQIAMRQLAENTRLGYYTVDQNNKTSRFNQIVSKYGVFAGLAYGLAEDIFNGNNGLSEQASDLLGRKSYLDQVDNSAKVAQGALDFGKYMLDNINFDPNSTYFYGDKTVYSPDSKSYKASDFISKVKDLGSYMYKSALGASYADNVKYANKKLLSSLKKKDHRNAFNKFRPNYK